MTVLSDCAVTIIMWHDTQGGSKFIMLFREAQELHMPQGNEIPKTFTNFPSLHPLSFHKMIIYLFLQIFISHLQSKLGMQNVCTLQTSNDIPFKLLWR